MDDVQHSDDQRNTPIGSDRSHPFAGFRHIAYLHDGTAHGLEALHEAVSLAALFKARLDVAIIVDDRRGREPLKVTLGRTADERLAVRQSLIARTAERAGVRCSQTIVTGRPSRAGLDFARERGADLIVISATSSSYLHDRLWGSRSARIARDGACSVLIVRVAPNLTS